MYQLNYRKLAIAMLAMLAVAVFYKDPTWVVELFYPDHFSDRSKPDDSFVFVICILGIIFGIIGVLHDRGSRPRR